MDVDPPYHMRAFLEINLIKEAYTSILLAFQDYTVDHRGDVGSWVRLRAIQATSLCLTNHTTKEGLKMIDQETFDRFVANLLKQGVERLDNVRQAAGKVLLDIVAGVNGGRVKARETLASIRSVTPHEGSDQKGVAQKNNVLSTETHPSMIFLNPSPLYSSLERQEWRDLAWSSEKLFPLLSIPEYRALLLEGSMMAFVSHSHYRLDEKQSNRRPFR